MNTLTIKLKQHTPLIHFQHDQEGATLRASEVKPKLDKYILTQLGGGDYEKGKAEAKAKGLLVGKGDHPALNYKMRIVAEKEPYEHEVTIVNAKKMAVFHDEINITVFSHYQKVIEKINQYVSDFFIVYNFGFRQSKGYGSFTVTEIDGMVRNDNGSKILLESDEYDKVIIRDINLNTPIPVVLNLTQSKSLRESAKRQKDLSKEIKKAKTINVEVDKTALNTQFCYGNYRSSIIKAIDRKKEEINDRTKYPQINSYNYGDEIITNLERNKRNEILDEIHKTFQYNYFEQILNEHIDTYFKKYKSGSKYPRYEKSHLRDFLGNIQGNTNIVYWDKRFMKQKINKFIKTDERLINLGIELRDDHLYDSRKKSELYEGDKPNQDYSFIRALLGLEGNFEFQTTDNNKRFIVSVEGENVERFQSVVIFKVINNTVYICIKSKEELKRVLGEAFHFTLNVKVTEYVNGRKTESKLFPKPIELGSIKTPVLNEKETNKLYEDITQYFNTIQYK